MTKNDDFDAWFIRFREWLRDNPGQGLERFIAVRQPSDEIAEQLRQKIIEQTLEAEPKENVDGDLVARTIEHRSDDDEDLNATQSIGADEVLELHSTEATRAKRQIGPYHLLSEIGSGGMGSVWMAEQREPVVRRVALKIIKAELSGRDVVARFEAERQALAMMDHPNIAKVLDAGQTDDGSPYLVMEYVPGKPITEFCDSNDISVEDRLQLFVLICRAIQHAHQKGIIHRDLKPGNILVCETEGFPVPKVIDFGLAKAVDHTRRLTDKTIYTEIGKVVGTLQYMSPEQAALNSTDIDTRSDIYSLGIILYELLTGSTPLERNAVREQAILKILEMIQNGETPRPSARLRDSGDAITGISQHRKIGARRLQSMLQGGVDWIVMKALEKRSKKALRNCRFIC
ncbi:MAG: serine/threonine-protein kinase [Pirellulaceae bacterium]